MGDFLKNWMVKQTAAKPKTRAEKRSECVYNSSGVPEPAPKAPEAPKITDPHAHSGDIIKVPGFRGEFVVEYCAMIGGDGKEWPNAWHVLARRLNADRTYNPRGKTIKFTQNTEHYTTCIKGVSVVGRYERYVR